MYGQVLFGDEDDLAGGIAAIRAAGFEATIEHVTVKTTPVVFLPPHPLR